MTTAEYRRKQAADEERDWRTSDIVVAGGCIVLTLVWVMLLIEVLA